MELELNTTHLNCYDTVLDTTLYHEETMESIVPDACPDILRIVDAEAIVCLKSKEAQEGRVEIAGSARVAVLYCPDGGAGVRRMTVTIPFTCAAECSGITPRCRIIVCPRVQCADARSLNPRKVLTRVNLAFDLCVRSPQTMAVCSHVECPLECGVQQLSETQNTSMVTAVEEKPFTFSDDITISGSKPPIEELLKSRVELVCNESKIIGSKLIFKGQANVQMVYRDPSDALCSADFELPFSQIMEVSGVEEEASCGLVLLLTGCECTMAEEGDGRSVSVSLAMLAQASVRESRTVTLLSDVYSTMYDLTAERRQYPFSRLVEESERRVAVREMMETVTPAKAVTDVYVTVGEVTQQREGNVATFQAATAATVVYLDESGAVCTATHEISASCQVELPESCVCTCRCGSPSERFATPSGAGIEVRFAIDFFWTAQMPRRASGISDMRLDEGAPRNTAGQPSMVLRMVGEGERLWDIAKCYSTTMEEIVRANALTEELPPVGQLLLIPKKR